MSARQHKIIPNAGPLRVVISARRGEGNTVAVAAAIKVTRVFGQGGGGGGGGGGCDCTAERT